MSATHLDETVAMADLELVQHLRGLEARQRDVEAQTATVLAELDRRKAYRADGHASMWGLLRVTAGWSDRECRERMRIARLVAAFPDAGELLGGRAGVGREHRRDRARLRQSALR